MLHESETRDDPDVRPAGRGLVSGRQGRCARARQTDDQPLASITAGPDAELIGAFLSWKAQAEKCSASENLYDAAEAAYDALSEDYPQFVLTGLDVEFGLCPASAAGRSVGPADIERWRELPLETRTEVRRPAPEFGEGAVVVSTQREPMVEARRRRDEVVAVFDAWEKESERLRQATGYSEMLDADMALAAENSTLRDAIARMEAKTVLGICLKAQVALYCAQDLRERRREFLDEPGRRCSNDSLYESLSIDLMRLVGPAIPLRPHVEDAPEPADYVLGHALPPDIPARPSSYQGDQLIAEAADAWYRVTAEINGGGEPDRTDEQLDRLMDRQGNYECTMRSVVSHSLEGLQAKAHLLQTLLGGEDDLDDIGSMAWSLADDLCRIKLGEAADLSFLQAAE